MTLIELKEAVDLALSCGTHPTTPVVITNRDSQASIMDGTLSDVERAGRYMGLFEIVATETLKQADAADIAEALHGR